MKQENARNEFLTRATRALFALIAVLYVFQTFSHAGEGAPPALSVSHDRVYELSGKWRFLAGDSPDYSSPSLDDSAWPMIYSHLPWNAVPEFADHTGNSWYRKTVILDRADSNYALAVSQHYRGAAFYINGNFIHGTRPFDPDGNTPPIIGKTDLIKVPAGYLKTGSNLIAIRTGCLNGSGGFFYAIKFGSYGAAKREWLQYMIWYSLLGAVCIFLFCLFLVFYYNRKTERYYLHFSIFSLSLGLWIYGLQGIALWIVDRQWVYIISTYGGAILVPVTLLNFVHSFLNLPKSRITKGFQIIYGILFAALLFEFFTTFHILFYNKYLYDLFILSCLIAFIYAVILCIKGVRNKRPFSSYLLTGTGLFLFSYLMSILKFLDVFDSPQVLVEGFVTMAVIFTASLASRFSRVHSDLEKAHSDLVVLDRMKDEFMATTSHELRTPLHGIIGISESLKDGSLGPVNKRQRDNLELMHSSAVKLTGLVNNILDFSRIKAGRADLYLEKIDPGELIDSVVSLFMVIADPEKISIEKDIKNLPSVVADRNRIHQLLINLIGNAVKFTGEGTVKISALENDGVISISVSDTGPGIEKGHLERIWNPFEQAESSDARLHSGVGLGLAIVKEIAEMHRGRMRVESRPGRGSVFTFELPVNADIEGIAVPESGAPVKEQPTQADIIAAGEEMLSGVIDLAGPKIGGERATILAVDDDITNLQVIMNVCGSKGYDIKTARTGAEALDIIKDEKIDLVLLDIMLPGMSGYEVCEKIIKGTDDFLPVIMVSARNQIQDIIRGFGAGGHDYITKPFDRQELIKRIETHLSIRRMLEKEKALNLDLNIYRHIVSSSGEFIMCIDNAMRLIIINPALLKALGSSHENLPGITVNKFFGDLYDEYGMEELFARSLRGEEVHGEGWYEIPGIGRAFLLYSMYPCIDDLGEIQGIVVNARDVTERMRLEGALAGISERERRQIGMELHDGLSHHLLGLAIKSKVLSDELEEGDMRSLAEEASLIKTGINSAIEQTRNLARGLFPVNMEDNSLRAIIEEIRDNVKATHNISCELELDGAVKVEDVSRRINLYYIIQEAVLNAVKHAGAGKIKIALLSRDDLVTLRVEDNGKGFNGSTASGKGMGLSIMKFRARMIGAAINIKSTPRGGTVMTVKFKKQGSTF